MSHSAPLSADAVRNLFMESGALLEGHFLLSSGLHSEHYMQCALILAHPARAAVLGEALARLQAVKPDLVLSPAMGGLIIGHEVGRALGVRAYFTEREEGTMALRRGFTLKPGEKVVVVEDVITTGKSTGEVVALARALGAEVIGVLSIVNRAAKPVPLDVPFRSLLQLAIPSFRADACPLCREGRPLVKPGSRTATK